MDIKIIELPSTLIAGLAVRTRNDNEQDPKTGWLSKTWERVSKKKYSGQIAAALTDYESDSSGYYTEVIGHEIATVDDLEPTGVLIRVPFGKYAKFTVKGTMPRIVLEAWKKVWQAELDGTIERSYLVDLERYPNPETVELFIAVK